jgi:undecaprenyl-diphosphatase
VLGEKLGRPRRDTREINIRDALLVGTVQGLAIIPGISRSGSTIATLLLRGIKGEDAARFSFLLALPAVFGAALLQLRHLESLPSSQIPAYLAGALAAFAVGLLSIHLLLAVIRNRRLLLFACYCWLVGAGLLVIL